MSDKNGWWSRATAVFNQNGGPWGSRDSEGAPDEPSGGPRNPWDLPPKGGKPRTGRGAASLDELQQRMRERLGGGGGGGDGGSGGGFPSIPGGPALRLGLFAILALWLIFTCFWRIAYNERGVVTRFGAYHRTLESGIGMTLPWPFEAVAKVNVTDIRELKMPMSGTNFVLTGDQNILDLDYTVRWSIADPELYKFQLADPEGTIQEVAESAMRAVVSRASFAGAVGTQRDQIEQEVRQQMTRVLAGYHSGIRIEGVAIINAVPPQEVNDAFRDVNAAQQEAQGQINNAKTYAQQVIKRAQGEAASFDKVYEQYRLAPGVTRRRMYYETMEEVLSNVDKTIVETPGVTPYLALPEMKRRLPEPPATTGGR
jgi:modulator of FtsH protease HflK